MRFKNILILFVALVVIVAAFGLAQKPPKSRDGTTLAAYKTIDICDLGNGMWRYSGEIAVWNEGDIWTSGFQIEDFIEYKPFNQQGPSWHILGYVTIITPPEGFTGEIPPGTTQQTALVFKYVYEGPAIKDAYIRNNVQLTILNHSGSLGTPKGPNPKATYMGPIPPPPCEVISGCTYTKGYWGNKPGVVWPSPYSRTDTFFNSGQTWQQVLDTEPRGNGYYILAHQYIAAVLNIANGASVPKGVLDTLDLALEWLQFNGPNACTGPGSCGVQKNWAAVLESYNKGEYPGGPPHCEDKD